MPSFRKMLPGVFLLALAAGPGAAAEMEPNAYVGVGLGVAMLKLNADREQNEANRDLATQGLSGVFADKTQRVSSLKLYGGYRFHRHIAVEAGFQSFSTADEMFNVTTGGPASYSWKTRGYGLHVAGLGILPATERLEVFAKGGIVAWHVSRDVEATGNASALQRTRSAQDLGFLLGVGGTFRLNERMNLRAEWERMIQVGDADLTGQFNVDFYTVSAQLAF